MTEKQKAVLAAARIKAIEVRRENAELRAKEKEVERREKAATLEARKKRVADALVVVPHQHRQILRRCSKRMQWNSLSLRQNKT